MDDVVRAWGVVTQAVNDGGIFFLTGWLVGQTLTSIAFVISVAADAFRRALSRDCLRCRWLSEGGQDG